MSALGVLLLLCSGCLGGPASSSSATTLPAANATTDATSPVTATGSTATELLTSSGTDATPRGVDGDALDATLVGYLGAENRSAYAAAHDLDTRDGRVEVVVELRPGRSIPIADVTVVATHGDRVQAYVAPADLRALASHENVSAVRTPNRPAADSPTGGNHG